MVKVNGTKFTGLVQLSTEQMSCFLSTFRKHSTYILRSTVAIDFTFHHDINFSTSNVNIIRS